MIFAVRPNQVNAGILNMTYSGFLIYGRMDVCFAFIDCIYSAEIQLSDSILFSHP